MNHRAQQTWWLLTSYLEWVPNPSTWSSNPLCSRADTGEAPSQTILCTTCNGEGRLRGNRCGTCRGHGVRTIDTYTGREISTANLTVTHVRAVPCDSCGGQGAYGNGKRCEYCQGTGHVDLPDTSPVTSSHGHASPNAAHDRQARQWRQGSYPELETLLHRLEADRPARHQLLWRYLVLQPPVTIGSKLQQHLEATVIDLSYRMPPRIRVPAWAIPTPRRSGNGRWANQQAQQTRDHRIREGHRAGQPTRELADEHGLTPRRVQEIVR